MNIFTLLQTSFIKFCFALSLITVFVFSTLVLPAQAAATQADLDALTATLIELGDLIAASPDLTDEERLVLLNQLIAISNEIVNIQLNPASPEPAPSATKLRIADVGVRNIVMDITVETARVKNTVYYATTSEVVTYQLTPSTAVDFSGQVDTYKAQTVPRLSNWLQVIESDIDALAMVSAYNPVRKTTTRWQQNEDYLLDLGFDMGRTSVVDSVSLYTTYTGEAVSDRDQQNGEAVIELRSDQGETAVLTLAKNDLNSTTGALTYNYSYEIFIPFVNDRDWYDRDDGPVPAKVRQYEPSVDVDEMLEAIHYTFYGIPFVQFVPGFDDSILDFLLENKTQAYVRQTTSEFDLTQCFAPTDVAIITEAIRYLLDAGDFQYIDFDQNFQLIPMVDADDDRDLDEVRCGVRSQIFY